MNIGPRIRELRKTNGLGVVEFAKLIGISQPYLSQIERGVRPCPPKILQRIMDVLQVKPADFFKEEAEPLPPRIRHMIDMAKELPPEQLKVVEALMDTLIKESEKPQSKKKHKSSQASAGGDKIDLSKIPMAAHIDGDDKVPLTPELEVTIIDAIRESRQSKREREKRKQDKI